MWVTINRVNSVNAEMPIPSEAQAAETPCERVTTRRLTAKYNIAHERPALQPERGIPNGNDLRSNLHSQRKSLHRLYCWKASETLQGTSLQAESWYAFGTGFACGLEVARPSDVQDGNGHGTRGRRFLAYEAGDGAIRYAEVQGTRDAVQQERGVLHAYARSDNEKRVYGRKPWSRAFCGIQLEAQPSATRDTKEPRPQDQRDETRKTSDEIVSSAGNTTRRHRIKSRCAKTRNNNALLRKLKAKGNVRPFGGGNVIFEEIMYTEASSITTNSYSGYETINVGQNSPISSASFDIKQYAGSVTMSGLETLQNSSKEQIIDLMEGRMKVAEAQLANRIDYDCYQDGTGNGGKNIVGLALAVPDTPTSGTYGGIDRATWTFWQSQSYSGASDGGAAVSAANIQQYMTSLALSLVRGSDKPDLWVADTTYFQFYVNSLQAIQRISSSDGSGTAGAGFPSLKFYGGGMAADVVMGSGVNGAVNTAGTSGGATSAHMWALNTDYIFFRPHRDRNFVPIGGERQSVNQDAIVKLIGWAGNMTSSGPQFSGVLVA